MKVKDYEASVIVLKTSSTNEAFPQSGRRVATATRRSDNMH